MVVSALGSPGWSGIWIVVMSVPPKVNAARGRLARTLPDQSTSPMSIEPRPAGAGDSRVSWVQVTFWRGTPASTVEPSRSCQLFGEVDRLNGIVESGI